MVKTVLGVAHQGLRDWIVQRLSAIYLALYTITLVAYFVISSDLNFATWHTLFTHPWMKVATILGVTSLLLHAWVGMWTVFTDYIVSAVFALILNVLLLFSLGAFFFWALQIVWSV
jgi:succinate dehydrogenase / fumarate reductase, membrane anchor subunit